MDYWVPTLDGTDIPTSTLVRNQRDDARDRLRRLIKDEVSAGRKTRLGVRHIVTSLLLSLDAIPHPIDVIVVVGTDAYGIRATPKASGVLKLTMLGTFPASELSGEGLPEIIPDDIIDARVDL